MNGREICHRVCEVLHTQLQRVGFARAGNVRPGLGQGQPWAVPLPVRFNVSRYCDAADQVLCGRFRLFALGNCQLGFPPSWNRDPKTGVLAPKAFGRTLNYRDEVLVGNIKYLWEPNRHLELVTVAQAWHLSRQAKYLVAFRDLLNSWFDQCPYPFGPHWTSSLELGIRIVNWSFAWHLFGGENGPLFADAVGRQFRHRWLQSIYQHCHSISRYPSLYSSANNHLLGEQLGLFVAATTWPKWPESRHWGANARELFEREAIAQNTADGVNREQSVWYQHEVMDMMFIAAVVAKANSTDLGKAYWDRLEAMLEFIASIMDVAGNVPSFGDSDDAVMARLCPHGDGSVYRSLLATGAVQFNRGDFKARAPVFDDKSRWLLGDEAATRFDSLPVSNCSLSRPRSFSEGGYYVLGSCFGSPREVKVVVDAGPLGYLSIAAHGHADALSFTLSAAGRELLIDPGTYAYHTDQKWRDYFRGTSAHNTLRVDGLDQSVSGGNFMWTHHATSKCEHFDVSGTLQLLVVMHDGYKRLDDPVIHTRGFSYESESRILSVEDRVAAQGQHDIEIYWHLSDQCKVEMHERYMLAQSGAVMMKLTWPPDTAAKLVSAEESPPQGWVSPSLDLKVPAHTLIVSRPTHGNWRGVSTLEIGLPDEIADAP